MDRGKVFLRVRQIVQNQLRAKDTAIIPEAHLMNDLGADSLDMVEMAMAVEEQFNISIDDSLTDRVQTVNDLILVALGQEPESEPRSLDVSST